MTNGRRKLQIAAWIAVSVLLLVALFDVFGTTPREALRALSSGPAWMYAVVLIANLATVLIGAVKWRWMRAWVSPEASDVSFLTLAEVTALGSLASYFLPPQPSHLLVRWWVFRRRRVESAGVLGSTFFEQVFDLIVYACAAALAVLVLGLKLTGLALAVAIVLTCIACIAFFRIPIALLLWLCGKLRATGRKKVFVDGVETAVRRAAQMPVSLSMRLLVAAIALLAARIVTVLAIAVAITPDVNMVLVAAGFPAVAFLSLIPITPAGFGLAEWSWGALLVAAGAAAPAAAIAALGFRLVNATALAVLTALFSLRHLPVLLTKGRAQ